MILKEFQIEAKEKILKFLDEKDGRIVVQSPTGSGKTIILCNVVKEYLNTHDKTVFVWFTPGAGELEEQSKEKFERFVPELTSKTLDEALRNGIEEKDIVFINWESVNKTDNKAIREGERKNLMERVSDGMEKGIKFILLIDEAHNSFTSKTQNLIADVFGKCKQVYVSATIDKKHFSKIDIEITEEDVIRSGLITRLISINEGISNITSIDFDENRTLLNLAIAKQKEIKAEYQRLYNEGICRYPYNPLIIIQYPNENKKNDNAAVAKLMDQVDEYLAKQGYTYDNKSVAKWLDGDKKNIGDDNQPHQDVILLHTKQALATGWDCPRAKILVKLREKSSETFEIQVLGRIRRMPEQKHYDIPLLDNCYLYTVDTKYKEAAVSTFGGKEASIIYLKNDYKKMKLGIKKQLKSNQSTETTDEREICKVVTEYIIKKYNCVKCNSKSDINVYEQNKSDINVYEQNKSKLLKVTDSGYDFDKTINLEIIADKATASDMANSDLHTFNQRQNADNSEILKKYNNVEFMISQHVKLDTHVVAKILKSLFNERHVKNKHKTICGMLLNFNQHDYRIFVINNYHQLSQDIAEARYHSGVQLSLKNDDIKEFDFNIAQRDVVYINPKAHSKPLESNVYHDFNLNMGHSQEQKSWPEIRFEKWCEDNCEWFYKNGDKGQEYLSIVYYDKLNKQRLFYPDYLIKFHGKLFIVETKGGETVNHENKNIDKDTVELKFNALKKYVELHNEKYFENQIGFAFVRDKNIITEDGRSDYELLFSNTVWTDELDNSNWKLINDLF